ncbi:hypothetical protein [Neobacillus sp. PS2-9]|uniref:hypothetical protein n=1 Tax=Neobacillus sp. PS2-9 TaxID=3070676 RepID=UPI0027DEDF5C|nr:hypothetical protein [Neobacillus sp. PS2-9]WML60271.1 hypothetical protein RCG25_11010 [Neobacillus sp. PS2-9]
MNKSNQSKWVLGITGTALSAFVISQISVNQPSQGLPNSETIIYKSMSNEEKEFAQLDWSNFSINGAVVSESVMQSDRNTRRS